MLNFVKISRQIKKFSIQELNFERSVCMAAICFSGPITAIPTNEQHLEVKRSCASLQNDISKTEALVCVYTERRQIKRISTYICTLVSL